MLSARIEYDVLRTGEESRAVELVVAVFDAYVAPEFAEEGVAEFMKYATPEALQGRIETGSVVFAARQGENLVGIAEIRDASHLAMFFVDSGHQRTGVGTSLLQEAVAHCRAEGARELTVNSSPNAVRFYQKQGFAAQDAEKTVNGIRFVHMKLELPGG